MARQADEGGQPGSPGFLDFGLRGECASSRLDHGLKAQLSLDLLAFLTLCCLVTSPKGAKTYIFIFFDVLGLRDPFQALLQALASNSLSKNCDLGMLMGRVIRLFVVFEGFGKLQTPSQ